MWHAQLQGQGVCVLFFFKGGVDFLLLLTGFSLKVGVFFEGVTGFFLYIIVGLVCFILLLISGVKKFFQNKCYLAAKFGTKPVDLL
jgi:hypothetical protein